MRGEPSTSKGFGVPANGNLLNSVKHTNPLSEVAVQRAKMRILVLAPHRYVGTMAFFNETVNGLAARGHTVHVLVSSMCNPPVQFSHPKVSVFTYRDWEAVWKALYLGFFRSALRLAAVEAYDLVLGLAQVGLICARLLQARFATPYVFLNDEILFGNERTGFLGKLYGWAVKVLERRANAKARFTITQDSRRGRFVAETNGIPTSSLRYLPNSRSGPAEIRRSTNLYKLFGFPRSTRIVLWIGGAQQPDGALELAQHARSWPQNFKMVFHFRTSCPSDYIKRVIECHGHGQTFVSTVPVPFEELSPLFASATIGLGLYGEPGINHRFICHSSGKVNQFLQLGVPCVVSNIEGLRWVEEAGAGVCVDRPEDVLAAAQEIVANYARYERNAADIFEKELSFDRAFDPIAEEMEALMERDGEERD